MTTCCIPDRYVRPDRNVVSPAVVPIATCVTWSKYQPGSFRGRICDVEQVPGSLPGRICDVEQVPGSFRGKICDVERAPGSFPGRICDIEQVPGSLRGQDL